jgi:hypothetical protein
MIKILLKNAKNEIVEAININGETNKNIKVTIILFN